MLNMCIVLGKGLMCHEYFHSWEKLEERPLPPKEN